MTDSRPGAFHGFDLHPSAKVAEAARRASLEALARFYAVVTSLDDQPRTRGVIVLLHGATLNHRMWDPVRAGLESRFDVITPDLPGHGSLSSQRFSLKAASDIVCAAVRSIAPQRVVLVGDSLGGYVAMASAPHVPRLQLQGLVLAGSSSNLRGTRLPPYLFHIAMLTAMRGMLGRQRFLNRTVSQLAKRIPLAHARAMADAGIRSEAFAEAVRALNAVDFHQLVSSIQVPILFVNGGRDRGHLRFEASFIAAAQSATSHRFPGVEHGVSIWRSKEFAEITAKFADEVFETEIGQSTGSHAR